MGVVNTETVKHVAALARLHLEGQALEQIAAQLDQILGYVQLLQKLPTDNVAPTSHVLALTNVLREDTPAASLSQDTVLTLAPERHPPFVTVPKVIETSS